MKRQAHRVFQNDDDSPARQAKRVAVSPTAATSRFVNIRPPAASASTPSPFKLPADPLPVFQYKRQIIGLVENNDVALIVGDTGCGKTTGVPHILFKNFVKHHKGHDRFSMVITQPRVVAATSVAKRVADQFSRDRRLVSLVQSTKIVGPKPRYNVGGIVGYKVRFEDRSSDQTSILFATDGLLIREFMYSIASESDKLLKKHKIIVIDEAHERSLRIDELLGITKALLLKQKKEDGSVPFKLIIMSATLDVETLQKFYDDPLLKTGLLTIPGRTFPVSINYLKSPCEDYLEASVAAVCQIALTTDVGDVLVFLPGADDIQSLCERINQKIAELEAFKRLGNDLDRLLRILRSQDNLDVKAELQSCGTPAELKAKLLDLLGIDYLSDDEVQGFFTCVQKAAGSPLDIIVQYKISDSMSLPLKRADAGWLNTEWTTLPLFSQLSYEDQLKVFAPPKHSRHRKIIVSTNIAETSITLPNIKFVVDSGKVKQKFKNSLKLVDVSRAMSQQRVGRAGRVSEGTAYRLFTEDRFYSLAEHSLPEIVRCDLAELLLDLKIIDGKSRRLSAWFGLDPSARFDLKSFPLPTYPEGNNIEAAEEVLIRLGALKGGLRRVSSKGLQLGALPLPVLWSNTILESFDRGCASEILTIVAMVSLDEEWFPLNESESCKNVTARRKRVMHPVSDHISLLNLYNCWEQANDKRHFCRLLCIKERSLVRAKQVRDQLEKLILGSDLYKPRDCLPRILVSDDKESLKQGYRVIQECLAHGLFLNIASRRQDAGSEGDDPMGAVVYVNIVDKEEVIIHPASTFYTFQSKRPQCIVYSSTIETTQAYARDVTAVDAEWVVKIQASKNIS
eukprot:Blabericola_migrator_1__4577@NODE_2431_length_2772_cov_59_924584_g1523_i0_p1_GENE_NODE_2431_length_2772_cov_59_924584_g1523_i0NODE_2431_length_2772_cov_59_924584_g1523_i0_p1_ORF_typecomplete_len850_score161_15OB_NTP_bind/PF07717_16/7_4e17DEAD/PF00270_29/2_8e14DEAD/PF00270_29/4_4e03DEAD/PF00270_29/4_6e03Flavi_DEAD/PF07652_14/1_7e11HA2/PF04408_23/1e09Helicase_C/PF00271_31/1_1e03Helicase_C/PF00271_31/4_6e08Helicase_C/PF00271_31/2_2e03ResIII/PF04851_15/2_5e07AAA_19/PF13245_6/5_9e07AAA_22/PF13401_6/5